MRRLSLVSLALASLLVAAAPAIHAATITVVNLDGAGEGFNDPTPVAPYGGNPETTLGAQRLYVFQYAARLWGQYLPSNVEILVEANFDPLDCDSVSGVLGSAGPNNLFSDFPNAPFPNTWYHVALANKLAGEDLDPGVADIGIQFNSDVGKTTCLPQGWYLGVDGHEGSMIELLPVVFHELGHGLGFSTSTLAGVQEVFPHVYDHYLYDNTVGMHWNEMTDGAREASAQNCNNLVWDGPLTTAQAPERLGPKPLLRVNTAGTAQGDYNVGLASFGPALSPSGISGDVVLAVDAVPLPNNGCEPFTNAALMAGKIALIDRGGCTFVTKVKNAQNAGAIAVIVADSTAGCPPVGMGGADPTITIPAVRIVQSDGAKIKAALLQGTVNVTMLRDPAFMAGADPAGRVQVYTPLPYQLGSSVSHWDTSANPDLLMEPALNTSLSSDADLTVTQLADIGWFIGAVAVGDTPRRPSGLEASFPNPMMKGASTIAYTLPRPQHIQLSVYDLRGRLVARLADGVRPEGRQTVVWDGRDLSGQPVAAGVYQYRLKTEAGVQARPLTVVR